MKALWINPQTQEHTFADKHTTIIASDGSIYRYTPNWCIACGLGSTFATRVSISFVANAGTAIWAVPAPPGGDVVPMRMAQRDDGYGTFEKHARMNHTSQETSSNPENSTRVVGSGSTSYR